MGKVHSPASSVSPITTPSPSTNQDQHLILPVSFFKLILNFNKCIFSRASAMLEKISQQPSSSCVSLLELAQKWRIPVLPLRNLWHWIAKAEKSENKPEFSELEVWPNLNLDGRLGQCPFQLLSSHSFTVSNGRPQELGNLLEIKKNVAVEVIQYKTDFIFQNNTEFEKCKEKESVSTKVSKNLCVS
ncbi:hypothetical protein Phum_PHUM257200 [Pediculus humanus corporis]|uniref:Uncharacterized protein n=1 Tax=Pediculus humanus subsp. corporis TaxID=121224 RepID=E0VK56_PEDHC|nr:uncharacterized protein Phum_PHUM257200 [Pediculus humanus corporis]EEB13762.1 hypothetical protein Phum_PHUM257200 [Pediculus humanus corporis]